jgi:hypothetical protein
MHQKEKTEAATVSVSAPDRGRGVAVAVGNDMLICTIGHLSGTKNKPFLRLAPAMTAPGVVVGLALPNLDRSDPETPSKGSWEEGGALGRAGVVRKEAPAGDLPVVVWEESFLHSFLPFFFF